jgi:hypothetical protein
MNGDPADVLAKWRQLVGLDPEPDFSEDWPVQHGAYMEEFILAWQQRKLGYELVDRGRVIKHPQLSFLTCTLDAFDPVRDAVIDAKCTAWSVDWALQYYTQLLIQRACKHAERAIMLISVAGREPVEVEMDEQLDGDYYKQVLERVSSFKLCMETMTPPVELPRIAPPEKWRTVDIEHDKSANYREELIEHLVDWRATRRAHQVHERQPRRENPLCQTTLAACFTRDHHQPEQKGHLSIRSSDDND